MKPVRFGIVGCGGIAQVHARCLAQLEKEGIARLVAGADVDAAKCRRMADLWNVKAFASLDAMLNDAELDVVTVATPSGLHADHCIAIAEAGKHILCEKPLDLILAKTDDAILAADKARVTLGCIFQQRFAPGPQKVHRAIEGGYFGEIVFVHAETPWYRTQAYYDSADWRGTWQLDCGVLANQSPHMIDRLIWLGGDIAEVLSATCTPGKSRDIEAETLAVATIRLHNGALGTITATTLAYDGLPQRLLICGTEGSAAFDGDELTYFKTARPFTETHGDQIRPASDNSGASDPAAIGIASHLANIRDYASAITEHRQPSVTAADGRRVVSALNRIYEKANVGPFGSIKH